MKEGKIIENSSDERKFDEELKDNASIIYTLKLEHGCFYCGRTTHLQKRLDSHMVNKSCFWVENHPFVGVENVYQLKNGRGEPVPMDEFMEDAITLKLMRQYGIDRVRGGRFLFC